MTADGTPRTIDSLELFGYRGFSTRQRVAFAAPNGGLGSGLTVFVGANNAGKSSVVEALRKFVLPDVSFPEGQRNKKSGERVSLKLTGADGNERLIQTIDAGGSETVPLHGSLRFASDLLVVPSRRTFSPFFTKGSMPRNSYVTTLGNEPIRGTPTDSFGYRLFAVQKNPDSFNDLLARVLHPLPKWQIEQTDAGQYYIRFEVNGLHHGSEGAGDGLVGLLFLIDALHDSKLGSAVVIDEPEMSLHPAVQRRLAQLFLEYSRTRQKVWRPIRHTSCRWRLWAAECAWRGSTLTRMAHTSLS